VAAVRPVSSNEVPTTVPTGEAPPLRNTSYPATPVPASVDAVHDTRMLLDDKAVAVTPPGTVGAVVSAGVETLSATESADSLPALSRARTVYEYVCPAVTVKSEPLLVTTAVRRMPSR
jgi:hypothetical protein